MADLPQTLESDLMQSPSEGEDEADGGVAWGRLFPMGRGFVPQGVSKSQPLPSPHPQLEHTLPLLPPDLVKDEYLFGRGDHCDYCFEESTNPHFPAFSKTHFRLYRVSLLSSLPL